MTIATGAALQCILCARLLALNNSNGWGWFLVVAVLLF